MASTLFQLGREAAKFGVRTMSSSPEGYKVAVLGAAGGIGQPLSLLIKVRRAGMYNPIHRLCVAELFLL